MNLNCPLCNGESPHFGKFSRRDFFECSHCKSIFSDPSKHLDPEQEVARYLTHNNDVEDPGYRTFVSPIVEHVLSKYTSQHIGLDFGAGSGPVISKMLNEKGYSIDQYDPFFFNNVEVFYKNYDYIICCEVIEHFYQPRKEFDQLRNMLNPGGELICMTDMYTDGIDFEKWYYKNDPTHVFFYNPKTVEIIQSEFKFSDAKISNRLIRFVV